MDVLAELITAHCERTGDSLAAIAHRGGMSRQTLSGIVNRSSKAFPRQGTLEKLARGLGLPVETVRQVAATATYGYADGPEPRRLVVALMGYAETLTDDQLEVALATVRALQKQSVRV